MLVAVTGVLKGGLGFYHQEYIIIPSDTKHEPENVKITDFAGPNTRKINKNFIREKIRYKNSTFYAGAQKGYKRGV